MPTRDRSARASAVVGLVLLAAVVIGFVVVLNRPKWEEKAIVVVRGWSDRPVLHVTVAHSRCPSGDPEVRVDEADPAAVRLLVEHNVRGDCEDVALRTTVEVELDRPLRERSIAVTRPRELDCTIDGEPSDRCH